MSKETKIQWCDSTVNPVTGCAGCELWSATNRTCYAGQLHRRWPGNKGFSPAFEKPKLFPGRMQEAARWPDLRGTPRPGEPWLDGLPRIIFVGDMGDMFSELGAIDEDNHSVPGGAVPFEYLKREIIDVAMSEVGQRHQWLCLTKRPKRAADFSRWLHDQHGIAWPANVWVGTSVTTRATLSRARDLVQVGDEQTIRFLSVEPQWEDLSLVDHLRGIAWVIGGGESAQGASPKPYECDWARRIRDECAEVGVAYFLKQLGTTVHDGGERLRLRDRHGGDWSEWPADLRVRQMPALTAAPLAT